jgi:hypothetical protein
MLQGGNGKAVLKHGRRERVRLEEIPIDQRAPVLNAYLSNRPEHAPMRLLPPEGRKK